MYERRRFARVLYLTEATLSRGEQQWQTRLVDISLRGALLERPANWFATDNKEYQLSFTLSESDIQIKMQVCLIHEAEDRLGLYCHHIDIDSITHLRRMIELNIGSEALLHRELDQLLNEYQIDPQP